MKPSAAPCLTAFARDVTEKGSGACAENQGVKEGGSGLCISVSRGILRARCTPTLARVVKLVDTGDLKSPGHCGRAGSSPAPGTIMFVPAGSIVKGGADLRAVENLCMDSKASWEMSSM